MDWSNLPPEILSLIFRYGSVRSVLHNSLVCANWRGSTCDPGLWKALYFSTTPHPAYRSDAKLDWRHLVLRKFIVKHNLKQSKCVVRSATTKDAKDINSKCTSLIGDWCTVSDKNDTYIVNVITEESIPYKNENVYLTSGNMMFKSSGQGASVLRDLSFHSLSSSPETQGLGFTLKGSVISIVRNRDDTSPFVALCFQRGYDDWYNNTGSVFGVYDLHAMKLLHEVPENKKIRIVTLYQHYFIYYYPFHPCSVKCLNLLTKEEFIVFGGQVVNSITAGSDKIVMSVYENKIIVYDIHNKTHKTLKIAINYCGHLMIYHDMLVCSSDGKVFFFDLNSGKLINGINLYEAVSEFSELSNGDLAVRTSRGVRVISFQQKLMNKRIRIQAIYQLEHKCHIQEETVSAHKLIDFIGSKVGTPDNINSFLFNVSATERYGIVYLMKIMGSPVKQKQLRNNYASRLLRKATNTQGYQSYSFTRSTDHSYYGYRDYNHKSQFVDGHAFLYYERLIDGRWELSSPSKPWPEK